jgi:hypothetical protein
MSDGISNNRPTTRATLHHLRGVTGGFQPASLPWSNLHLLNIVSTTCH